jgi:hypothetical protein
VTEKARRAAAVLFKVVGRVSWQIRRLVNPEKLSTRELRFPKSLMPRFQEKPLSFRWSCPYRKPTLVGGEIISQGA